MQTMHTCGIKDGAFILPFYPTQVELTGLNWLTPVNSGGVNIPDKNTDLKT